LTFDFARSGRADVRVARIFNTYGPHMDPCDGRVVSNVICQALSGEPITIYGDGNQTRSFCYVADTVDGLRRLMEARSSVLEPVNIGNPCELKVQELVELVLAILGRPAEVIRKPLPVDDPRRRRPDIGRARALFGWEPRTTLEDGLRATIEWFAKELTEPTEGEARSVVPINTAGGVVQARPAKRPHVMPSSIVAEKSAVG
jgi:UDP-glucuronate decarboxylase